MAKRAFKRTVACMHERHLIKYTQQLANEYRLVLGRKVKPVVRLKKIERGKALWDRMEDIETRWDKESRKK